MKYRRLGKTDLRVSVIGVGTWQFGGEWGRDFNQSEADQIIGRAGELGMNLIDTAECYGDHVSERLVGNAIRHEREKWVVATKFGHKFSGHLEREQLWTVADVRSQLEDSLSALQTDVIDLYQFHSGSDVVFDNDELWSMLNKQVEAGKIRHLGISISSGIDPAMQIKRASEVGAGALQVVYNRLSRSPEEHIFPESIAQDLGVLARIPLASGFLSGKYKSGDTFDTENDVRASFSPERVQESLREVEAIRANELPAGVPMAQWALAWGLQHPAVTCVIPGCKNVAQVEVNAGAAMLDLVREDHLQAYHQ
ncbi:MAG: aldo/keto reductase [Chloroflexi bacterium]|nr:aldo/keto reductase [Chloroflexota bacterium]